MSFSGIKNISQLLIFSRKRCRDLQFDCYSLYSLRDNSQVQLSITALRVSQGPDQGNAVWSPLYVKDVQIIANEGQQVS